MILFPALTPVAYYAQAEQQPEPVVSLSQKDKRLRAEISAREFPRGSVKNVGTWIKGVTRLSLETTELALQTTRDYFIFGTTNAADLMEAYAALYRLRWVGYKSGTPNYMLTDATDQIETYYLPQNDPQKRRFSATATFLNLFDKMSDTDKAAVLSGTPLKYSELSPEMQQSFRDTLDSAEDVSIASAAKSGRVKEKRDRSDLSDASISISDKSKPGSGVREMWLSINSNSGGSAFRWNDYDPKKTNLESARPTQLSYEPEPNNKFSRPRMLQQFKKLTTLLVTVPESERTLAELLKYISTNYGIHFITNEDTAKQALRFSCENLTLADALDKIGKQYGDWEWEACRGDFVVLRSKDSPRRRKPAPSPKVD